MTQQNNL